MAAIKYKVELTEAERSRLNEVSQRGKASVRTVKRALSLLKADQGLRDREIADVLLVNAATVARARKRYVEEGLEAAINDRPRPGQERKLDGKQEAHLIAFACSAAPAGHTHWTLQLLADFTELFVSCFRPVLSPLFPICCHHFLLLYYCSTRSGQ